MILMYKNIICFFSFPFITWNVHRGKVRESPRWARCTDTGVTVQLFCEPFQFCSAQIKIFPGLFNFLDAHTNLMDMSTSSMPPMQFTWYFCWGTTYILFTLGNRCISCYATYTTCVASQSDLPVNIQHLKPLISPNYGLEGVPMM